MSSHDKKVFREDDEEPIVEESVEAENVRKRIALTDRARNSRLGRELIAYCIFLILFTVVTVLPNDDPNLEGLNYAATRLFLQEDNLLFNSNTSFVGPKFIDIGSVDDIWQWLRLLFILMPQHVLFLMHHLMPSPGARSCTRFTCPTGSLEALGPSATKA